LFSYSELACVRTSHTSPSVLSGLMVWLLDTSAGISRPTPLPPPGEEETIGADASHAWCSVWVPEHGWVDLDPTNGIVGVDRHVTVGRGRDYADVARIRGVVIGPVSTQTLSVSVDVARLS
jgi:transglutaminase-like putative cysteine protease